LEVRISKNALITHPEVRAASGYWAGRLQMKQSYDV
jgi:hypothetical protein